VLHPSRFRLHRPRPLDAPTYPRSTTDLPSSLCARDRERRLTFGSGWPAILARVRMTAFCAINMLTA